VSVSGCIVNIPRANIQWVKLLLTSCIGHYSLITSRNYTNEHGTMCQQIFGDLILVNSSSSVRLAEKNEKENTVHTASLAAHSPDMRLVLVFESLVQSGFLALFGQDCNCNQS
jgi:hypothetical protein